MDIRIAQVALEEILDLRHRILRAGLPVETARFAGDEAASARHFAAFEGQRVVGCLTLHLNDWDGRPAYQLRGMAVEAEWQRSGVGRRLLEAAEAYVRTTVVGVMWCNARVPAAGFYERAGWTVMSDEFEVPTAGPHVRMVRRLTTTT